MALPAITAHFRLALGDVQWLVICYVLVYGSLMLVCGKLGDLFGHRLIFRIGLAISAVGCAACAAAPDWPLFLWARGRPGRRHGAGALLHAGARHLAVPREWPDPGAGGLRHAPWRIAAAVGPLLGGVLVELWGWPAVYWIRVPIALLTLGPVGPVAVAQAESRGHSMRWARYCSPFCMSTLLLSLVLSQRREVPGIWTAALFAARASSCWFIYVRRASRVPEPIIRPGAVRRSGLHRAQRHERAGQPGGLFHPAADALLPA